MQRKHLVSCALVAAWSIATTTAIAQPDPDAPGEPAPAPEAPASAQPAAQPAPPRDDGRATFGVGIHAMLTGPFGPALVYNRHRFHVEGVVAFANAGTNELAVGGRFWLHVHQTRTSSLSLGGGGAFSSTELPMPDPRGNTSATAIHLEGGAQIRFFVTPNVALSAAVGLGIVSGDADLVVLTGNLNGAVGLTYFLL
jgi:hypothetical protein